MEKNYEVRIHDDYSNDLRGKMYYEEIGQAIVGLKAYGHDQHCEGKSAADIRWEIWHIDGDEYQGAIDEVSGEFDIKWNPIIKDIKIY